MKSKALKVSLKLNHLLILFAVLIMIYGFSKPVEFSKNQHLIIVVEHYKEYQILYVSELGVKMKKIAIVDSKNQYNKYQLQKNGFKIKERVIDTYYDNTAILELLQEYGNNGWVLSNHNLEYKFGGKDRMLKVNQYIMTR